MKFIIYFESATTRDQVTLHAWDRGGDIRDIVGATDDHRHFGSTSIWTRPIRAISRSSSGFRCQRRYGSRMTISAECRLTPKKYGLSTLAAVA